MDDLMMRQFKLCFHIQPIKTSLFTLLMLFTLGACSLGHAFADDQKLMMLSIANMANDSTGKTVQAKILIDAPPNLVWETITNYPEIRHIYPGYEKSTVLQDNGSTAMVDLGMKVSPFLPTYHYQVVMKEDLSRFNLSVKRVSGDFKSLNANYRLVAQNNGARTLLIYNLNVDTGMNFPGSHSIIKANTERSMKALGRYVMQELHKSLIGQR